VMTIYLRKAIQMRCHLNPYESLAIVRALAPINPHSISFSVAVGMLECTEEMGDVAAQHSTQLAASIYLQAHVFDKVVRCLVLSGNFADAIRIAGAIGYVHDYAALLNLAKENLTRSQSLEFGLILAQRSLLNSAQIQDILEIEMKEGEWDIVAKLTQLIAQNE